MMHEAHAEEVVKSPRKSHGPAEDDSGDEETTSADIQQALQKGTYEVKRTLTGKGTAKLKYTLQRHLSGHRHQQAASAREEESRSVKDGDVPSDAQMMFVYDEVKKSPMVPPCHLVV